MRRVRQPPEKIDQKEKELLARTEGIRSWAAAKGLRFSPTDVNDAVSRIPIPFVDEITYFQIQNVMGGTYRGTGVIGFELVSGGEPPPASCAVTCIPADCPPITLARENLHHRLFRHAGVRTISTDLGAFNREWEVLCRDPRFADAFVDQRMILWLLERGVSKMSRMFFATGAWVACFTDLAPSDDFGIALDGAVDFVSHIPRDITDLYPGRKPRVPPWERMVPRDQPNTPVDLV